MEDKKISVLNILSTSRMLVMLAVFIVPLLFWPGNIYSFVNLKLGLFFGITLIVLILWSISRLKNNDFNFPKNLIALSVLLIIIFSLLSSIFSSNSFLSLFGSGLGLYSFDSIFLFLVSMLLISSLFYKKKSAQLLTYFTYFSFVLSIFVYLLYLFIDKLPNFNFFIVNSINTIGKWSDLGIISALVFLISYLTIETNKEKKILKIFAWIGLVLSVVTIFIVNETVVWILLGIISVFYLVYRVVWGRQNIENSINKNLPYSTIVIMLISFVMILSGNLISGFTDNILKIDFSETRPGIQSTLDMSTNVLKERPLLGLGVNRFSEAWQNHKPDYINQTNYWGTDFNFGYSYLTSFIAQTGILGILSWILFIVLIIWNSIKLLFRPLNEFSEGNSLNVIHSFSALFIIITLLIHVPSVSVAVASFVFLGLFLGSLIRSGLYKTVNVRINEKPKIGFVYIFSIIVLMILSVYLIYVTGRQFTSTIFLEKASHKANTGDLSSSEINLINSINVYTNDQNLRALSELNQIQMRQLLQSSSLEDQGTVDVFRSLLTSSINSANTAIKFDPENYQNYISVAKIYDQLILLKVQGAYEQSISYYEMAREKNMKNPGIFLDMARSAFLVEDYDQSKKYIQEALNMKPMFADAAFLLSQIQIKEGNISEAIRSVEASIALEPNNSNLYFQLGLLRYNSKDYSGAVVAFEKSVILQPYFSNAKYYLGLSYEQMGRTNDAILQFEDLKVLNPENELIENTLKDLKEGNEIFVGGTEEDLEDLPLEETAEEE